MELRRDLLDYAARIDTEAPSKRLNKGGWSYLGRGGYRLAMLGPDDLVYKIPRFEDIAPVQHEEAEIANDLRARKLPGWLYIPEVAHDPITKINVMEYVRGEERAAYGCYPAGTRNALGVRFTRETAVCRCGLRPCVYGRVRRVADLTGITDMHCGNYLVMMRNAKCHYRVAIIDLGFKRVH